MDVTVKHDVDVILEMLTKGGERNIAVVHSPSMFLIASTKSSCSTSLCMEDQNRSIKEGLRRERITNSAFQSVLPKRMRMCGRVTREGSTAIVWTARNLVKGSGKPTAPFGLVLIGHQS